MVDENQVTQCYIQHVFTFATELEPVFCHLEGGGITVPSDQPVRMDASASQDPNFYYMGNYQQAKTFAWYVNDELLPDEI